MPVSVDTLRLQLDYSAWATQRLLDVAAKLSPEELTRDFKTADKSVLDTLVHVYAADRLWLRDFSDDDVLRVISYQDTKGRPYSQSAWQIILHLVNHGTHHRGQVSGFLRAMGHTPPPLDLIAYYRAL